MHDIVIRGGQIVDAAGTLAYAGDVAIENGVLAQVGGKAGPARRDIDAAGALVTPGFVDAHSHYDGQVTWDDTIDPSFSNGITTTMMGMCGVGFAPAKPHDRDLMIAVMEGVEAIPGIVLAEGVPWKWQSFPEYLDFLDGRRFTMDVGTLAPHAPMRVFAMGDRAVEHQDATRDEIEVMKGLVREAMTAGAFGISAGRITEHVYGQDRRIVPGTLAEHDEFFELSRAMAETGGIVQIVPRGAAGSTPFSKITREDRLAEHQLIEDIARACGRPVHYLLQQFASDPHDWSAMLDQTRRANEEGLEIHAHVASRGFGIISMLDGYHNFQARPSYLEIAELPIPERVRAMQVPARRAAILSEKDVPLPSIDKDSATGAGMLKAFGGGGFLFDTGVGDFEPTEDRRAGAIAGAQGIPVEHVLYDHLAANDGRNSVVHMLLNYAGANLDHVYDMLRHPNTLSSLGDGGAHMKLISDSSMLPFHLTFWARDRVRGPRFTVEAMVKRITSRNAHALGLNDRGRLIPGLRADLNIIDFANMALKPPVIVHDLPAGGARLNQETSGFLATIVGGKVTRSFDQDTGERPGRLLRHGAN